MKIECYKSVKILCKIKLNKESASQNSLRLQHGYQKRQKLTATLDIVGLASGHLVGRLSGRESEGEGEGLFAEGKLSDRETAHTEGAEGMIEPLEVGDDFRRRRRRA